MSKLIAEEIVEAVTLGDKEGFMSAFHSALAAKVSDALEIKKVEIASTLIAPASSEVVEEEVERIDEAKYADDPAHKIASELASKMNAESPYKNNKGDVHKHIVHSTKEGDGVTHFVTQKRDLSGDHNTPYASVTHRDNKIHWEVGNSRMKQDPSGVHSPKEAKSQLHAAIDATHKHIRNKYDMDLSPEEARAANQARVQKSREDNMKKEEVEQTDEAVRIYDRIRSKMDPQHGEKGTFQGEMERLHMAAAARDRRKITKGYGVKGFNSAMLKRKTGSLDTSLVRAKKTNEEVEEIEEAKGETRISWRARTPEEIAKSDKRRKVKVTSAELEARARARRAEKSDDKSE